jgi:hypothetical protein
VCGDGPGGGEFVVVLEVEVVGRGLYGFKLFRRPSVLGNAQVHFHRSLHRGLGLIFEVEDDRIQLCFGCFDFWRDQFFEGNTLEVPVREFRGFSDGLFAGN